jgi:pyruvate,water dikinase
LAPNPKQFAETPPGAILFVRRPSPEIVEVFPRISGVVAEWGNIAGHAAALLRESKIPSVFQMAGVFDRLRNGDPISLDAVQPRIYAGTFWPSRQNASDSSGPQRGRASNPITERLLNLNLVDPAAANFRPSGCRSAHDVLRFCHEKAIETIFMLGDSALEHSPGCSKKLLTPVPIDVYVLDLGGGLRLADPQAGEVRPSEILSRPFQALWRGVTNERVQWRREMPASLGDFASVMASSLTQQNSAMRALGESSYLLVADEYMNLNSRLAYHFSLVDACVSDTPSKNFISFRFAGGGAQRAKRDLRACFLERCLTHFGFVVDRRGDLVNAWFKKLPAADTEANLDILGRLMACSSQLDMYMANHEVMLWYVQQFLAENYSFRMPEDRLAPSERESSSSPAQPK